MTLAYSNTRRCAHIDHLILRILGFCAAFSFNDGLLFPSPLHMCPLQHAIPQRPLLHDASPPPPLLSHSSKAHARGTQSVLSGPLQEIHSNLSLGKSLPYGEEMLRIRSCLTLSGDGIFKSTSVQLLHKH